MSSLEALMKREQVPYPTNKIALLQRAVFGGIPGPVVALQGGCGRREPSDQPAAYGQRGQPRQPGEADGAEHRRRAMVLDPADRIVVLGRDVVGQLFDCGVEELDRKQPEQRGDHRHVPGDGRCNEDGRNEAGNEGDHLLAERSLAAKAIADSP
jgi:hypothetical protein